MTYVAPTGVNNYRNNIVEDVKNLIEKYHIIVEGSAANIDNDLADALIFKEMRNALKRIQDDKLNKIIN